MPTERPGVVVTDAEKNEAIRRIEAQLREWRERNPDASKGRPVEETDAK